MTCRSLDNVKVVVTRAKEQADEFAAYLEDAGAEIIYFPTIEFIDPDDTSVIDSAINSLDSYDWIIFTSVNAVRFFFKRLEHHSLDAGAIEGIKVGVVGPKTASVLKNIDVAIDLVPEDYRAEGLISGLTKTGIAGKKILLPRAFVGREVLPVTLRKNGADLTVAPIYKTVAPSDADVPGLMKIFAGGGEIVLTFTSGSTVKNFFKMFTKEQIESFIDRVKIAAISPVTANIVKRMGYHVDIVPKIYTGKDLADAIKSFRSTKFIRGLKR